MTTEMGVGSRFKRAVPILHVRDAVAAERYYCEVLGFKKEFMVNDGKGVPHFAGVSRDGVLVCLTTVTGEVHAGECMLGVEDVDGVFLEFKAKGVKIKNEPRDLPWGREFTMWDLDGNYLIIGK